MAVISFVINQSFEACHHFSFCCKRARYTDHNPFCEVAMKQKMCLDKKRDARPPGLKILQAETIAWAT